MVRLHKTFITGFPLALAVTLAATGCGRQFTEASSDDGTDTAGETSEDEVGDSGTESSTTNGTTDEGTEEGTTDEGTTDEGTTDEGTTEEGTTDEGTTEEGTTDEGTTEETTEEGTTEETTEETTDSGGLCDEVFEIEILAVDADYVGWAPTMSMLGEGMVLVFDDQQENYVSWDIDIPCEDTWHVWVRGFNAQQDDSYFALVDGEPDPVAIFEIACDFGPFNPEYQWRELNWRDLNAPGCEYVEDPWLQDWDAGVHNLTLAYRESYAVSRIWVTNSDSAP